MKSVNIDRVKRTITDWYGIIPTRISLLREFCLGSTILLNELAPKARLRMSSQAMCYTDGIDCFISANYFRPEFYEALGIIAEDLHVAIVGLVNGTQVHESLHIKLTPYISDLKKFVCVDPRAAKLAEEDQRIFQILNIIEDLYIELWCGKNHPHLHELTISKNQLLFGDLVVEDVIANYTEALFADGQPNLDHWKLQAILLLKRFIDESWRIPELYDPHMLSVAELIWTRLKPKMSTIARAQLVYDVYVALELDPGAKVPMPKPGEGNMVLSGELDEDLRALIEGLLEAEGLKVDLTKFSSEEIEALAKAIALSVPPEDVVEKLDRLERAHIIDVLDTPKRERNHEVELIQSFYELGRRIKRAKAPKKVPGTPLQRGQKLVATRLWRAHVDEKVFANRNYTKKVVKPPHVYILLDLSGSMGDLVEDVADAAYSMFVALRESNVSVTVYGHSSQTDDDGEDITTLVAVAAFRNKWIDGQNQTHGNFKMRFDAVSRVRRSQNYDGNALNQVFQLMDKHHQNVLINLSDGEPLGESYSGSKAKKHTMDAIARIRKAHVRVLALSLRESVEPSNISIYGEQNHLPAYGGYLTGSMHQLVLILNSMDKE